MSVVFSAAVALATLRRCCVSVRRVSTTCTARGVGHHCAEVELCLAHPDNPLLRTHVAVALRVNPITEHHHIVWWHKQAGETDAPAQQPQPSCNDGESCALSEIELNDRLQFFHAVREAQWKLSASTGCTDFNISWQEGSGAPIPGGFTAWARYVHIVPRLRGDLEGDVVHELIEKWTWREGLEHPPSQPWPLDDQRQDRTDETMAEEAARFRSAVVEARFGSPQLVEGKPAPFSFAHIDIPASQVFYESLSGSTVAFVNLRPLRPGHVLVSPRRCVRRLSDLSIAEYEDLIQSAWEVGKAFERARVGELTASFTNYPGFIFAVQDGPLANQSIPHVHIHIIPRAWS